MSIRSAIGAIASAVLLAASSVAVGAPIVVYDSLGPANTFTSGSGFFAADPGNGANYETAQMFDPSGSGWIDEVSMAIRVSADEAVYNPISHVRASIRADVNGTPGAVLDETELDYSTSQPGSMIESIATFEFGADVFINSGQKYWLTIGAAEINPDYFIVWASTDQALATSHAFTGALFQSPGQWFLAGDNVAGAARIQVQAVNEPNFIAATLLFAAGLFSRRRVRAVKC